MSDGASTSTHLAWAARHIADLQAPGRRLPADEIRFEMRRIAVVLEGCAEDVRGLELRNIELLGVNLLPRDGAARPGPTVDRLAEELGVLLPSISAPARRLVISALLRKLLIPSAAMIDAGAAELAPYATDPKVLGTAARRARDVWTAMVAQARLPGRAVR